MQEVTGSSPVPSTKTKPEAAGPGLFVLPGHSRGGLVRVLYCCAAEARPADETAEVQRKRGAACGRYSRAGVGAAVQIYEHAATCDANLGNGNQRGRALIFASPRRRAQKKSASATRTTKQGVSEPSSLRGRVRIRFFFARSAAPRAKDGRNCINEQKAERPVRVLCRFVCVCM